MTRSETAKFLANIAAAYPEKFKVDEAKLIVWSGTLEDIDLITANIALKKHLMESPFVPTIHHIRKAVLYIQRPEINDYDSSMAWEEVKNAIKNYGSYYPEEAYNSMSELTRTIAKRISWNDICNQELETMGVLRGQFMKMYDAVARRKIEGNLIPDKMKDEMKKIAGSFTDVKQLTGAIIEIMDKKNNV